MFAACAPRLRRVRHAGCSLSRHPSPARRPGHRLDRDLAAGFLGLPAAGAAVAQRARSAASPGPLRHAAGKLRGAMMALVPPRMVVGEVSVEDDRGRITGTSKTQVDGTVTFQATPCAPGQDG